MQMLSAFLAVSAASPSGDPVTRLLTEMEQQWPTTAASLIPLVLLGQLVVILANYLASKALAVGESSTVLAALRVWVLHWILVIGTILFTVVALFALTAAGMPGLFGIVFLLIGILFLVGLIRIPMDVYEITGFRAIGFLIAAFVFTAIGNVGIGYAIGRTPEGIVAQLQTFGSLTPAQRKDFVERVKVRQRSRLIAGKLLDGEDIARDASRPLPERAQALKRVYRDLETNRLSLRAGDAYAKDVYELRKARYEALLEELRAEAARNRTEAATPPP